MREAVDYIEEYYNTIKEKYPHLTYEQIEIICRIPFRMLKDEMRSGSLRTVRLKYFGTFNVNKRRAIAMYRKTVKMHEEKKITSEIHAYILGIVSEYLKREYNETLPCP